jgi:hydrogenase maturation protease
MERQIRALVAGVGNMDRGDDAIGLEIARAVSRSAPYGVLVEEITGDLTDLLDLWAGMGLAVVVDAMRSSVSPGSIERVALGTPGFSRWAGGFSTHGLSLPETVALGKVLQKMPEALILYGVEAESVELGRSLSPLVAKAVPEATRLILHDLFSFGISSDDAGMVDSHA